MLRANSQDFFCQKYWRAIRKQVSSNKQNYKNPDLFDYNDYNYVLLGIKKNTGNQIKLGDLDLSFKLFEPAKKKYVMWRGVTDPSYFYENIPTLNNYFNKCKNIKTGEILCMKEFSYISCDCAYAKNFICSPNDVNILFEIEIPEGTRFFNNGTRNVLPRCSKFLCTSTKKIKDKKKTYQHIKLTLLPKDTQQESELKENFIQKILNKLCSFVGRFF